MSVFGSATAAGTVRDSVVAVFGSTHVTGPVANSVVTVIGNTYINSHVRGDVVTILGNVSWDPPPRSMATLPPSLESYDRHPDAVIHGGISRVLSIDVAGHLGWARVWIERCLLYGRPLAFVPGVGWAWTIALGFLALYALLALVFQDAVERCVRTLETHPGRSVLAALLAVLLTPLVFALFFVTVIGIAVLPFLAVGLFVIAIFGKVALLASFRAALHDVFWAAIRIHTALAVLVAGALLLLIYTVPIIGLHRLQGVRHPWTGTRPSIR